MDLVPNRCYEEKLEERQRSVDSMVTWHNYCYRRGQQTCLLCVKVLLRYLQCFGGYYFEVVMVVLLRIVENEVGVLVKQHMRGPQIVDNPEVSYQEAM